MKRSYPMAILFLMAAPAWARSSDAQAQLDAIVAPLTAPGAPGCAVAAARDGQRIATTAFGLADLEHDVPNTADSVFEAGSVSKQFTAAAILTLVADGKFSLRDDIREYLPEMPDYGHVITIDHLLNHTSGLRDWGAVAMLAGWERSTRAYTNDDALRIIARQKVLNYQPGAEYSYTNSGYNLMAIIVERVSGHSLADYSRMRLFEPLAMTHTSWRDDFRRIVPNHAIAYGATETGWEEYRPFENVYGNGGLLTTVGDLLTWNEALTSGKLGAQVTAQLQERATLNNGSRVAYARGLRVSTYNDHDSVSHSGATGGYRAWLERFPDAGLSIAVLCNGGSLQPVTIGRDFAGTQLPAATETAEPRNERPLPAERAGLYVAKTTGKPLRLLIEDGELKQEDGPIFVRSRDDDFRADHLEIDFTGPDEFMLTAVGDSVTQYERAEPFSPAADRLAGYAGRYYSEEAGVSYDIARAGNGLVMTLVERPTQITHLAPSYPDAFVEGDTLVRFRRDGEDAVPTLSIGVSRVRDLRFTRLP